MPVPIARLRWLCRRGMRELDLVLEHFLERHYPTLSEQDKVRFEELLGYPDQDIMEWIMDRRPCPEPLRAVVAKLDFGSRRTSPGSG